MKDNISQKMIEAGTLALHACDFRFMDHDAAVILIYEAMEKAKKQPCASNQ
jgi:hypothetical protein